jgi:hypothetical protein
VTLRARWVTLRARWVTLRARSVTLRASWVTLRARWVTLRARWVKLRASRVTLISRWVMFVGEGTLAWLGRLLAEPDWADPSERVLAFMLRPKGASTNLGGGLYVAFNASAQVRIPLTPPACAVGPWERVYTEARVHVRCVRSARPLLAGWLEARQPALTAAGHCTFTTQAAEVTLPAPPGAATQWLRIVDSSVLPPADAMEWVVPSGTTTYTLPAHRWVVRAPYRDSFDVNRTEMSSRRRFAAPPNPDSRRL